MKTFEFRRGEYFNRFKIILLQGNRSYQQILVWKLLHASISMYDQTYVVNNHILHYLTEKDNTSLKRSFPVCSLQNQGVESYEERNPGPGFLLLDF